jgi:glucosamine-6-phosphate deaminase
MNVSVHQTADVANHAAADLLWRWLTSAETRNVMVAAGNTPLELYRLIGERAKAAAPVEGALSSSRAEPPEGGTTNVSKLNIFMLDEYVGVPLAEPRNCANLLRRSVVEAWRIPAKRYFTVSSLERDALESVQAHERRIQQAGGLDVIILGLGQNGHLGFNEPGSTEDSEARLLDLQPISVEANRKWFGGDFAPAKGATVGLRTILAARHIIVLAYGAHKTEAVAAMVEGKRGPDCPASFLQGHADIHLFLDEAAAAGLRGRS